MRPAGMLVGHANDSAQVSLIEYDDEIQTIPKNRADHSFDESILPMRAARCNHLLDTQALDPCSGSMGKRHPESAT
jgi:hypothetical protein